MCVVLFLVNRSAAKPNHAAGDTADGRCVRERDAGCTALAEACGRGGLAKCFRIYLGGNPASDAAKRKVSDAIENRKK